VKNAGSAHAGLRGTPFLLRDIRLSQERGHTVINVELTHPFTPVDMGVNQARNNKLPSQVQDGGSSWVIGVSSRKNGFDLISFNDQDGIGKRRISKPVNDCGSPQNDDTSGGALSVTHSSLKGTDQQGSE